MRRIAGRAVRILSPSHQYRGGLAIQMFVMWHERDAGVTRALASWAVVTSLLGLGCSAPSAEEPEAGDDSPALDLSAPVVGSFAISLVAPTSTTDGFTSFLGRVYEAPVPDRLAWDEAASAHGCQLRIPEAPFCDPACGSSDVCTRESGCVPFPKAQELGAVTLTGLSATAIEMMPVASTYQLPPEVSLPHPPTDEGAAIRLQSAGGAFDPFTIQAAGIAPLELTGPEALPLDGSATLSLSWQPPADPSASRIQVKVDISHHGGLKGVIECDVEDDGSLEIDAELVAQLIELGTAGWPTVSLSRVATGGVNIAPGLVYMTVSSRVERALEVPGVVSCNENDECGADEVCSAGRFCESK